MLFKLSHIVLVISTLSATASSCASTRSDCEKDGCPGGCVREGARWCCFLKKE
ncbi:hypothetical protein Vi05172_g5942 [Venturia inaequalis]|nr:hypothetical protein Vi05172_g5942 [Venturia inaequalis]